MTEKLVMDMSADQYELYAEFGITAEKFQVLEIAAGNVALAFFAMFVDKDKITPEVTEMYRAVVDDVNRKTFGALLEQLKKTMKFDDSITTIIDEALGLRNYLTHHFFRTHNFALYSEDGRKVMMGELEKIQTKFDLAHQTLDAIDSLLNQVAGLDGLNMDWVLQMQARGKRVDI